MLAHGYAKKESNNNNNNNNNNNKYHMFYMVQTSFSLVTNTYFKYRKVKNSKLQS
jgi:hypothetical protein